MTIEIGQNLAACLTECRWQLCIVGSVLALVACIVLVHLVGEAERIIHAIDDLLRGWRGLDKPSAKLPWVPAPAPAPPPLRPEFSRAEPLPPCPATVPGGLAPVSQAPARPRPQS